ncbi:MAG: O-antigen ligase family protein [Verrucomicrobiota bacterium]
MTNKLPIPLREKLVAAVGALTLAFTAWGYGGVIAWSLHTMLAGGLLTIFLATIPLSLCKHEQSEPKLKAGIKNRRSCCVPLSRLLRFPGTWFACAFLIYLAIGALNPAWQVDPDLKEWRLRPLLPVEPPLWDWLPTSVKSAYEPMNTWRIFNMHLGAFSLALGLYVGLTRRKTVLFVLWVFVINASSMAFIAIVQHYGDADAVLWTTKSANRNFWGSFFYRNQAVAYLNWGIVLSGVLYFYHAHRIRDEAKSGGPHFMAFCLIGLFAVSVGLALSRGGILFAGILVAAFLLLVAVDYVIAASSGRAPLAVIIPMTLTVALLLAVGLFQAYKSVDWQAVRERFGDIEATIDNADQDARALSSKQTWKMAQDNLWTGWGAGSFRYVFPIYQKEITELYRYRYHRKKKEWIGHRFYRYAHNDILQFLAEYGIIGSSLLLLSLLGFVFSGFRFQVSALWVLLGTVCAAAHAFLDFIFHSPAYWCALVGGLALVSRLSVLKRRAERVV